MTPAAEPADFNDNVRKPGLRAIAEMVGKRPPTKRTAGKKFKKIAKRERDIPAETFPTYWTDALDDLMAAYHETCAYSCFRIHPVTGARAVDHFVPKSRNWRQVYEWSNYRLCASRMNARKGDFQSVVDPFEVKPGWFHLELLGFQVVPNPVLPATIRARIQQTIDQLHLNSFATERLHDAERYWDRTVALTDLRRESPFVAYELHRQGALNAGDTW